jgi:excisionase family DNA binding protein
MAQPVKWIGTPEACARLGVTLRTLYRFIDEGQLPAYKMGRVIRLQEHEVEQFIQNARIAPGTLEHLYPEARPGRAGHGRASDGGETAAGAPAKPLRGRRGQRGPEGPRPASGPDATAPGPAGPGTAGPDVAVSEAGDLPRAREQQ